MANTLLNSCAFTPTLGGSSSWVVSAAIQGYLTPANAGAVDGAAYSYRAENAAKTEWEDGVGVYTAAGTTLTRQVRKSSNSNSAVVFTNPPNIYLTALAEDYPLLNSYVANNWYVIDHPGTSVLGPANAANGTIRWTPFRVNKTITIGAIGARINTIGSSNFQCAIYADVGGVPSGAPLCSTGNISNGTAGVITASVTAVQLTPGIYWFGINGNDATYVFEVFVASAPNTLVGTATASNLSGGNNNMSTGFSTTQAFGTWPTNPTVTPAAGATSVPLPIGVFQVQSVP